MPEPCESSHAASAHPEHPPNPKGKQNPTEKNGISMDMELGVAGLEPGAITSCDSNDLRIHTLPRAAESAAPQTKTCSTDSALGQVVAAWAKLSKPVQAAILAIINATATT